jgi:hypothetical protein
MLFAFFKGLPYAAAGLIALKLRSSKVKGQASPALLLIIVMLVYYARPVPFPERTLTQCVGSTGHADQVECSR